MKKIIAIILLLLPLILCGQTAEQTTDPSIEEVVILPEFTYGTNSVYIKANDDSTFQYSILDLDKNNTYMTGKVSSIEPLIRTGRYAFFTPEGIPFASGFYSNNIPYLAWSYFDKDGQVIASLNYSNAIQFIKTHGNIDIGDDFVLTAKKAPKFGKKGMKEFAAFIKENAVYPPFSLINNEEGRVLCQFVIDKTGQLINTRIVEGVNEDFDLEVFRLLSLSPLWKPGKINGEAVNVLYTIPIHFKITP